jgi:hypothetical protein
MKDHDPLTIDPYCEDYDELLRLMQIPDIKKIIFHRLARVKDEFRKEIACYRFSDPKQHVIEGNIIHLNPREYYFNTADQRLKEFFEFCTQNREFREMILKEFYSVYKPMYAHEDTGPKQK